MKGTIILIFILLATASPTGQSVSQPRHAPDSNSWRLIRFSLRSEFLLPSLFTIFGSLLTLSLIALGTISSTWPKLYKTAASKERSYFVKPSYVTPLYVNRVTEARIRLAQRRVAQVSFSIGLPQDGSSDIAAQVDCKLWKKKCENMRVKRKERLAKGPRIDPEKLKRINHEWMLFYGFKIRDLFHIENELDNVVSKVPRVDSKKSKTVKFDNSVNVVYIENNNTGRRMSKWKTKQESHSPPEFTSDGDILV